MLSKPLQFYLVLIGFSPVALVFGLVAGVDFLKHYDLHFLPISKASLLTGLDVFFQAGGLYLLSFILLIPLTALLLKAIRKNAEVRPIETKSIKSYDFQMNTVYLSYILPFAKFAPLEWKGIYTIASLFILLIISWSNRRTYSTNVFLSVFFSYRHFEVQTRAEVTYIMMSKRHLINTKDIRAYIKLADFIILDPEK